MWHPHRSRLARIRASVLDVKVSTFKKSQSRNKRASRTEAIVRLLLIILWAVVVVVLGFYSGFALPPLALAASKHKTLVKCTAR